MMDLKKITLIKSGDEFQELWDESVSAIIDTLKIVSSPRDFGAIHPKLIPYPSIIPIFSAIRYFVKQENPTNQIDVKEKIRKWYWASIFTNRYSSSVESTSAKDYVDLKSWFNNDEMLPQSIKEYSNIIDTLNLREEIGAGSAIYKAILNLIVINGAKDFSTGGFPEHEELDDHHIVPKSWGKKNGLTKEINSICNRTLIAADTNRFKIGMSMPSDYLKGLLESYSTANEHGKNLAREILDSHFISEKAQEILMREDFSADDYKEFIQEREKSLKLGIKELLMNEVPSVQNTHLDLLNKDIEQVEVALRKLICSTLNNELAKLPTHILGNAQKRIQSMLKKDGAKK